MINAWSADADEDGAVAQASGLLVVQPGIQSTIQDLGRHGYAGIGVGTSGAADQSSFALVNRLVRNDPNAACIEITLGGFVARAIGNLTIAVAGAPCPLTIGGRAEPLNSVIQVASGAMVSIGVSSHGLRAYLAVRGGIDVEPVLGSRSTDLLADLGPERLVPGIFLPMGPVPMHFPNIDLAPISPIVDGHDKLRVVLGPRDNWFTTDALKTLLQASYSVTSSSNRIGMRLDGPPLLRSRQDELPAEGTVRGSIQVPPSGRPTIFLADHPVTGGYPVIAVVMSADVDRAAQMRPGSTVSFGLA